MLELFRNYFDKKEWVYYVEDNDMIILHLQGDNGVVQCLINIFEEEKKCIIRSYIEKPISSDKKVSILQWLNHLNNDIFIGGFEIDESNNFVRFRSGFSYQHFNPEEEFIDYVVMSNIVTMDMYQADILGHII
jgi:hypothetical protein